MSPLAQARDQFRQALNLNDQLFEFILSREWPADQQAEINALHDEAQALSAEYQGEEVATLLGVMAEAGIQVPESVLQEVHRRG